MALYGCDVLENDQPGQSDSGAVLEKKQVYVAGNGSAFINLDSLVKSGQPVVVDIASTPARGTLHALGDNLLEYVPHASFRQGRDAFQIKVFSTNNTLLDQDSVVIIVNPDSTNLPCGIYPQTDVVQGVSGTVTVDVLKNDFICSSMSVGLAIYAPQAGWPPYHGTAVVTADKKIMYTPGASFQGTDKIIYKVYNLSNDSIYALGTVYFPGQPDCNFTLQDDSFFFQTDTVLSVIPVPIFANDTLCSDSLTRQFTVVKPPANGTLEYDNQTPLLYHFPAVITNPFVDSLRYQVCYGQTCRQAKVLIKRIP